VRVGVQLPSFTYRGGESRIGQVFGRVAKDADQGRLDSLWVMDHFFQIGTVGPADEPMLECYAALSYAAALTQRITLGALVTGVTYRHPGILVKTVTTLDVLSSGRAWLGIGAAWNGEESRGLGVPFPPVSERFERLEETLQIARQMWRGDETPYRGRHYSLERPLNKPAAVAAPRVPILIGGGGERKTLRLVAKYADACNVFDSPDLPRKFDVLRAHCEREHRPYEEIEKTVISVCPPDASTQQVIETCGRLGDLGAEHVIFSLATMHTEPDVTALVGAVEHLER
jgi:F420-dependent oxidoreductase-like protein